MTKNQKIGLGIAIGAVVVIVISAFAFRKNKPGVGAKFKCDQQGDDSSKFYGDNFKARGAVCDGLYIPVGSKLSGQNTIKVLEWMGEINGSNPIPTNYTDMKKLAEAAAIEASKH